MDTVAITRRLMQLALPILLSSLIGLFAPLINAAIVGRDHAADLYVLGVFLPVGFLQLAINESLRVSAITFSSRAAGSGDLQTMGRRLEGLLSLAVLIYLAVATVFWLASDRFMGLYVVPVAQQALTSRFIQLNILVGTLVVVSMTMMSALYGLGQAFRVTAVTIISFTANILLTLLLVAWEHWGLYALITSTLITASATIAWAASQLARLGVLRRPGHDWLRDGRGHWREIAAISLPVFASYLILFAQMLLFNRLLALFAPAAIAGFGVAYRIQNIVLMPAIAIGVALAIEVNRMVAAKEQEGVFGFLATALGTSLALFVGLGGLVFAGRELLPGLVADDQGVVAAASQYLTYMGPTYVVIGPLLMLLVFLEETGQGLRSMVFNAGALAVQIGLAFYLAQTYHSLDLVYQAIALSHGAAALYILYELARSRQPLERRPAVARPETSPTVASGTDAH